MSYKLELHFNFIYVLNLYVWHDFSKSPILSGARLGWHLYDVLRRGGGGMGASCKCMKLDIKPISKYNFPI